jgi:multimeric flavodoxin WrbA
VTKEGWWPMKVVAFMGSPRKNGNTARLTDMVLDEVRSAGHEAERIDICGAPLRGCTACMGCFKTQDRRCAVTADPVNQWIAAMDGADAILLASPTYFANVTAEMKALIDRAGLVSKANGDMFRRKVGAGIVAVRRSGAAPVFDAMNRFFLIGQMVVPGSSYWNLGVGLGPGDVEGDAEGVETMHTLGKNLVWAMEGLATR